MRYDLRAMILRQRAVRRRKIVLREIAPPAVMATNLYRAAYEPVSALWQSRMDRIMAAFAATLSEVTTDSAADVQREIDDAASEFQRLLLELVPALRDWAIRMEEWVRGRWRGAVLSATGVDLGTFIGPQDARETIETFIARNTALLKDVSAQGQGRISDAVFRGLNQRKPAREVAAEFREAVAMSRRRSMGIASHQLSDLSNRLADERRREAGLDEYKWRHSGKLNGRPEHKARDGKTYSDANPPPTLAGEEPYCGCRTQAVISFD